MKLGSDSPHMKYIHGMLFIIMPQLPYTSNACAVPFVDTKTCTVQPYFRFLTTLYCCFYYTLEYWKMSFDLSQLNSDFNS